MADIKWRILKDKIPQWIRVSTDYSNAIKLRLRKDLNLADLTDKNKARENLELVGEVSSHHHDSRYKVPLDAEVKNRTNADNDLLTKLNNLAKQHNTDIQGLVNQITANYNATNKQIGNLQTDIDNTKANITKTVNQAVANSDLDKKTFTVPGSDSQYLTPKIVEYPKDDQQTKKTIAGNPLTYTSQRNITVEDGHSYWGNRHGTTEITFKEIKEGVQSGLKYTLADLLMDLVKMSHKHTTSKLTTQCWYDCDCNCDCNCD